MKGFLTLIVFTGFFTFSLQAQIDFSSPIFGSVGSSFVSSVAIGDVNNDGRNDAIAATTFSSDPDHDYSIFVFLQKVDGSVAEPVRYPFSPTYGCLTRVQVADVNNDNRNDVIFTFRDSLGIRFQDASGELGQIHSFYSGKDTDGMKTGDLNSDGLTDIAICHWNDPFIKVFYQKAEGGFQPNQYALPNAGYDELDVKDMNGDGLDDIVYMPGQMLGPSIYIYYQNKVSGIPATPVGYSYQHLYHSRFNGIATGDLNNDGRNDLVATMGGNGAWIALIYQKDDGTLQDPIYLDSYDIPTPVEIADLNCDGKNEIIVGHRGWSSFSVWEQDESGKYSGYKLFGSLNYVDSYGLAVGDFNNDLRADVLTTDGFSRANFIYNSTVPAGTLPIDTIVRYSSIKVDTSSSQVNTYIATGYSKPGECLLETNYELTTTTYFTFKESIGDTLFPRSFTMCGLNQNDSLRHHFEINKYEQLYHTDTISQSVDTLTENCEIVYTLSRYDTITITPQHSIDTLAIYSYLYTPEMIYFYMDSIRIESFVNEIFYNETRQTAFAGLRCGFIYRDTVTEVIPRANIQVLESDTLHLSKTVIDTYPLGINETTKISNIRVYPNPAKDACNIEILGLPSHNNTYSIQLISMTGQIVWKDEFKTQTEIRTVIDGSNLTRGVYTLLIKGKDCAGTSKVIFGN